MNEKLKEAMLDMILDLDAHFPEDEMTDEDYEWFYKRFIEPIVKAYIEPIVEAHNSIE